MRMHTDSGGPCGTSARPAFALLAVLWIMVMVATLSLVMQVAARESVRSATRRAELTRGFWLAEDCLARALTVIDASLTAEGSQAKPSSVAWRTLAATVLPSPQLQQCSHILALVGAGSALDVNAASAADLRRLLMQRIRLGATDSIVDAILDWRDGDGTPRAFGAERPWYDVRRRLAPRNGLLADLRELDRIRGTSAIDDLYQLLGTESGRVSLVVAPRAVLASLPGMSEPAITRILELRDRGELPPTLADVVELLQAGPRDSLRAHFAELSQAATIDPEAWILTARARVSPDAAPVAVELRLTRSGGRAVVVRRREWP